MTISNYSSNRKKLDLRDFNRIIDHVDKSPLSYSGANSRSYQSSANFSKHTKHKWVAFELQRIGGSSASGYDGTDNTSTLSIRTSRWRRNGNKATPAELIEGLEVSNGDYYLDYRFSAIGLTSSDYSTSSDGDEYSGFVYVTACLDNSTSTSNIESYATWNAKAFDADPSIRPNKYHLVKVKEDEIDDLYSGIPSHMDSCKQIVGAVRVDTNGYVLSTYQYIDQDINDQLDAHSWDCFKVDGTSFYMLPGYFYVNGETTGPYYTPATTTTINGITVYNITLTASATNYIYVQYRCVGAGTPSVGVTTVVGNADSDGDAFRKLLWTITLDADAKITSYRRHQMEDVMYWDVVSEIYWDRDTAGKIEYRIPNCTSYFEIAQAEDCP